MGLALIAGRSTTDAASARPERLAAEVETSLSPRRPLLSAVKKERTHVKRDSLRDIIFARMME
jgi:hypothetical protein